MALLKSIQSWIYVPVVQSDRPESLRYGDQAETVFSELCLRPSWRLREDLVDHIVSRVLLEARYLA